MNDQALHARFMRGLGKAPRQVAVRVGADSLTYEELHERAALWAGALLASADERPRQVGVLAAKSLDAYAAVLAALYAGATVVPLNPGFPAARIRRMLEFADVSAVVADERGLDALPHVLDAGFAPPVLAAGGRMPVSAVAAQVPVTAAGALSEPCAVRGDDVAYVLFTSGSTGRPKGVPITHGNMAHYFGLLDRRYDFNADDVFSQTFDLNFDCATFDIFCAWGAGAAVHAVPPQAYRDMPAFVEERGMTVWFSTPSAISLVRRLGGLGAGTMPSLRWSFFAGEALRCADAAGWQEAADGSTVENLYGPTELTVTVTGHRWDPEISPGLGVNGIVPIGRPHDGHDHLLLDEHDGEGELCVAGPQLTPGYLDPADNEGRYLERDGRTWYRTGDRVRCLGNGELAYLGRLDSQVQVQGVRVELPEIEHALRGCDGVEDAVVVLGESTAGGDELVAFYTGARTGPGELAARLRETLPAAIVPRRYRYLRDFPLNSNRKIDRRSLAAEARGS
ncbi:AMP-binding protein [Actinomadura rudentiformis]|uniref:AMP-binding protein n=1 Tax=Actinomadura rudentiformis TaxID=359158 RepID=A0A6H9YWN7_9ACTN|nr:AMP-binding protein [Actinomadura rudentiformis]KAB2346139.1 AMP-binding protein [Actinomadura rudentiformis]